MATSEVQAFVGQASVVLLTLNAEMITIRADQDANAATSISVTHKVADFKAEQGVTAQALRAQQNKSATLQSTMASFDLTSILLTQGLVTEEKMKSTMHMVKTNIGQ